MPEDRFENMIEELHNLAKSEDVELSLGGLDKASGGWNQHSRDDCKTWRELPA